MFLPLRDENPLNRIGFQFVTVALIAACTIVLIVQVIGGDQFDAELVFRLGMIPVTVLGELRREPDMVTVSPWITIFTSMFLHGGFWHLFGNMIFLWIFGDNVEDAMGHWRFALFYLLCGALAGLTHAAVEPASQIPHHRRERRRLGRARRLFHASSQAGRLDPGLLHADPASRPGPCSESGSAIRSSTRSSPARQAAGSRGTPTSAVSLPGALLVVPLRKRGVPLFDRGFVRFAEADALPAAARGGDPWNGTVGGAARQTRSPIPRPTATRPGRSRPPPDLTAAAIREDHRRLTRSLGAPTPRTLVTAGT